MLVRGLVSLRPQLVRHGADELNWVEIWLGEMVRQESYTFFTYLLDEGGMETLLGSEYHVRRYERKRKGANEGIDDNSDIKNVIEKVGGINERQANRLIELVNAARKLAGFHLQYSWKFALARKRSRGRNSTSY